MSMFKGEKVLVTGGAGFLGSHLARRLVSLGATVTIVDNLSTGRLQNIEDIRRKILFLKGDLRDQRVAIKACSGRRYIFHLAADMGGMGYIAKNPVILNNNLRIDLNMLSAAYADVDLNGFLYASSACVYPEYRQDVPWANRLRETDALPAQPDTLYGWEKLTAEFLFKSEVEVRLPRLHNVYGPYSSFDERGKAPMHLIMKAIKHPNPQFEIWGDGKQTRSFLYIDDCIDGLIKLMESNFQEPINIGSDKAIAINNLAKIIIRISGKNIFPKHNYSKPQGVRGRCADITLARKVLGWEPKISLEEGLMRTYDWAKSLKVS